MLTKKVSTLLICLLILMAIILPTAQTEANSSTFGVITADQLRVRQGPGTSYPVLTTVNSGDQVKLSEVNGNWVKIEEGWVAKEYIRFQNSQSDLQANTTLPQQSLGQVTVNATSLNIRDKAALDGHVIGAVANGETFRVLEESNDWLKIEYTPGETGWAASWFFTGYSEQEKPNLFSTSGQKQMIMILNDGTNIRNEASTHAQVLQNANKGDRFEVIGHEGDWYHIKLSNGNAGYVAGWIVSISGSVDHLESSNANTLAKRKTVIIDPGHGGKDVGTIGASGTLEKTLTLETAKLLYEKSEAAQVNVFLTRDSDSYLSLSSRVAMSHYKNADAFISLHFDSTIDNSVRGITSYYYHDDRLATSLQESLINWTGLADREARFGDYYVIRENCQMSALLELGYLSNPTEEKLVSSEYYQETVATAIFEGLMRYFEMQ